MPAVKPVAEDTEQDADLLTRRRRRWLVVAGVAMAALVVAAAAIWMFRSPAYEKFCSGGGPVAPVRPSAEEAFEAWAGDKADDYERRGDDTWVLDEGGGRTREASVAETDGGYIVVSAPTCTRYPAD